ncbi:DUF4249 domain-containing protein [Aestuariivivens sediminicola]|uniref:DUF4249 domain-containing protein n=1 Tax=Aestuariivivens sediminicola TaxID=2913560 RepID=UPI001F5689CF|nr:DUF4249 domain-containing protein [Aestuariivivens sediminicola]
MKKYGFFFMLSMSLLSCEDVIDVALETSEPRLVIDAGLNWFKGTSGQEQHIRLSLTAPFYDADVPPATGATVYVTDTFNNRFDFIEENGTGSYINDAFIPRIDGLYFLTVIYDDETYTASGQLQSVSPIEFVEQNNNGGFAGDETELEAYYTDPLGIENYYLFEFINTANNTRTLEVYDDEFTDGNQIFAFYADENLKANDIVEIRNFGISNQFYEFMNILLQQTDEEQGDPFEVQPATVRGNCINETNPENYPLGYFRLSEASVFIYEVE